jgi:CO/xanthine dehydrogenase Mo-binding subunit
LPAASTAHTATHSRLPPDRRDASIVVDDRSTRPRPDDLPSVRIDAWAKLRGQHRYPTDYATDDMLSVRLVRSDLPHGIIKGVDVDAARAVPGVVDVLRAADVPGTNLFGLEVADQPVLCGDRVRRVGDPIALVVATSDAAARLGAISIRVQIEPLPVVTSVADALAADAVHIHPGGNMCATVDLAHGDVDSIFASADIVHESTYTTPRQSHVFLEVEGGIAYVDDGVITVIAGGQNPFADRRQIAAALDVPVTDVRVINPPCGGAFGGKEDCSVQIPLALAALRTGRPCRFVYDRRESLVAGVKRHPFEVTYRSAATGSGRLLALDVLFVADAGAYTALSPSVIALAAEHAGGAYDLAACRIHGRAVFTNNGNSSAFRGFGSPQVLAGLEQHLDLIGRRCGLDAVEVRRRNLTARGGVGVGVSGLVRLDAGSVHGVLDAAGNSRPRSRSAARHRARGVGRALGVQGYGLGLGVERGARVVVGIDEDGRIDVAIGSPDMGTGSLSTCAQIVAEQLGATPSDITVRSGDSAGPDSGPSNASRSLFVVGNATARAAVLLGERIRAAAAKAADVGEGDVELTAGGVIAGSTTMTFAELVGYAGVLSAEGEFLPTHDTDTPIVELPPHPGYAVGLVTVTVDVDLLTGVIEPVAVDAIVDPGRIINRPAVRSQIEGGIAQGIGFALYEDAVYVDGRLLNDGLATYLVPTVADLPVADVDITLVETPSSTNELGVRGIGELALAPTAPAIANAVADAIGIRFDRFPIRAEDVLSALDARSHRVLP